VRHAGDGWVACGCGAQHWGRFGAAGLLVSDGWRRPATRLSVVLQHRALWSHHGGTWGIPGGALGPDETPAAGALREAVEEAGVPEAAVRLWTQTTLEHPDWSYATILGEATRPFTPTATDAESLELAWVPTEAVPARELLPAFGVAWPALAPLVGRRALLVVDGANVVGARPDGWWRDRAAAAARLHAALSSALSQGLPAATLGLPADHWWPDVLLVLEGAARSARLPGPEAGATAGHPGPVPTLAVARAPAAGDDAVVTATEQALLTYTDVVAVTADRALRERIRSCGGSVVYPSALLAALA
jgi:8-oxo-dGTP pyrophosphatase MutT (NUDIX family)